MEPRYGASKPNTPPSEATSQYPPVVGSAAMPTIGALRWVPAMEPRYRRVEAEHPAVGGHQGVAGGSWSRRCGRSRGRCGDPRVIEDGAPVGRTTLSAEKHRLTVRLVVGQGDGRPLRRTAGAGSGAAGVGVVVHLGPGRSVPRPGVVEIGRAIETAEEDELPERLVVVHARAGAGGRARYAGVGAAGIGVQLRPGGPVEVPGGVSVVVLPTEEDELIRRLVIGHGRGDAGRRASGARSRAAGVGRVGDLCPARPVPRPRVVGADDPSEKHELPDGRVERHDSATTRRRTSRAGVRAAGVGAVVQLRPRGAVPGPRVVQIRTGALTTEQDHLTAGRVVGHRGCGARGRTVGARIGAVGVARVGCLRPGGAVPGPGVIEIAGLAEPAEEHHLARRLVVGSHGRRPVAR